MISFPTLWSNSLKIQAFGEEMKDLDEEHKGGEKPRQREEEWSEFVIFPSPPLIKVLLVYGHWIK